MNPDRIHVYVVQKRGRESLYLRFRNPVTRKDRTISAETTCRKKAERKAAQWESELRRRIGREPSQISWAEFRARYEDEQIRFLADGTATKLATLFDSLEAELKPSLLCEVTGEQISRWQTSMQKRGLSDTTIKGYSAHLRAALNWAHEIELLLDVPKIRMPTRAKGGKGTQVMKGRPITAEEFERMLQAVPKALGDAEAADPARVAHWRFLLNGLWWSGLRISEAYAVAWDGRGLRVNMDGKRAMLCITAESEKGNKDRLLPMAPEFAGLLQNVPQEQRHGFVFNPCSASGRRINRRDTGRVIAECGRLAGVKVYEGKIRGKEYLKTASAHDLRRAFGLRWATRIMPAVLKELMRHESIETTMRFYVGTNADTMSDLLYAAIEGKTAAVGEHSLSRTDTHQLKHPSQSVVG